MAQHCTAARARGIRYNRASRAAGRTAGNYSVRLALTANQVITPLETIERGVVLIRDGVVERVGPREAVEIEPGVAVRDFGEAVIAPGFVDIHIHGGAGHDVMQAAPSALAELERHLLKQGVTAYFPTTVTAPVDVTLRALENLGKAITGANGGGGARPLGVHLEGPFISHAKRGVHPPAEIRPPDVELFERMWQASGGTARVMTVAPELPAAEELIRAAAGRGICVSLGHSDADFAAAQRAMAAGARHATHTFNAMRALDHREPGILGAVLSDDRLHADIIADGVHVDSAMVRLFLRAKGEERAVLITDAISATGMPAGRYKLGGFEVDVTGDRCLHEGRLAGSVLTLDRAVRNVMSFAGWPLARAVRLASLNPARLLNLRSKGQLVAGAEADIVVLSPAGAVIATFVGGISEQA